MVFPVCLLTLSKSILPAADSFLMISCSYVTSVIASGMLCSWRRYEVRWSVEKVFVQITVVCTGEGRCSEDEGWALPTSWLFSGLHLGHGERDYSLPLAVCRCLEWHRAEEQKLPNIRPETSLGANTMFKPNSGTRAADPPPANLSAPADYSYRMSDDCFV